MSTRPSRRTIRPALAARRIASVLVAATLALGAATCSGSKEAKPSGSGAPTDPTQLLYNQGKYAEALPQLEKSAADKRTGTLVYQIGYCRGVAEGPAGGTKMQMWAEAEPLLEKEVAEPGGATLDRLYYLTAINSAAGSAEKMETYARKAVDTIEKGPNPNALSGEDWFRLARIHEFLQEASEAEAAYRRAVSGFEKTPAINPSYQALALAQVGDLDLTARRFDVAAKEYTQALTLVPGLQQVNAHRQGLALFGAGRFEEAAAAFGRDREAGTNAESQYAADLARKAKDVAPLKTNESDGTPIDQMPLEGLDERIKQSGAEYRAAREKNSFKPGDPLPAEVADKQRRFVALLRERLLQTGELQDFCLKEELADLVRR